MVLAARGADLALRRGRISGFADWLPQFGQDLVDLLADPWLRLAGNGLERRHRQPTQPDQRSPASHLHRSRCKLQAHDERFDCPFLTLFAQRLGRENGHVGVGVLQG
jgi:hypothetical protein